MKFSTGEAASWKIGCVCFLNHSACATPCPPANRYKYTHVLHINTNKYIHINIERKHYYRNIWHNLPPTHTFPSQTISSWLYITKVLSLDCVIHYWMAHLTEFWWPETTSISRLQKRNWAAGHFWQRNPVLQRCCIIWRRHWHSQTNIHFLRCQWGLTVTSRDVRLWSNCIFREAK